jgi:hypothetical protein
MAAPQTPVAQPGPNEPIQALVALDTIEVSNVKTAANGREFAIMKNAPTSPAAPVAPAPAAQPAATQKQLTLPAVRTDRWTRVFKGVAEDLSFQERNSRVSALITDSFTKPDPNDANWKIYPWTTELYLDRVVFELDGKTWQVSYEMDGDDAKLTSDAVEVVREWRPIVPAGQQPTTKHAPAVPTSPPPAAPITKEAPVAEPKPNEPIAPAPGTTTTKAAEPVVAPPAEPAKKDDVPVADPVEMEDLTGYVCGSCGAENAVTAKSADGKGKGDAFKIAGISKGQFEKLDEPVRKSLLSAHKAAAEAQKIAKAEQEKSRSAEFVAKAASFKHLGMGAAELGPVLKGIHDGSPDVFPKVEQLLRAADAQIAKGALFGEKGKDPGEADATTAEGKLDALAKSIAAAEKMPYAKAYQTAMERDPQLYAAYEAERSKK